MQPCIGCCHIYLVCCNDSRIVAALQTENYWSAYSIQWNLNFMILDFTCLAWSEPNIDTTKVELQQVLCFCNFLFSLTLHYIFLVPAMNMHPTLHFIVQFSSFLIHDNKPCTSLAVTIWFENMYHMNDPQMYVIGMYTMWLHYSLAHMSRYSTDTVQMLCVLGQM
jgi:hypothetical protein